MRVEPEGEHFVIISGKARTRTSRYFCFFVDDDSACWSKRNTGAAHYGSRESAESSLAKLRDRQKARRARGASL